MRSLPRLVRFISGRCFAGVKRLASSLYVSIIFIVTSPWSGLTGLYRNLSQRMSDVMGSGCCKCGLTQMERQAMRQEAVIINDLIKRTTDLEKDRLGLQEQLEYYQEQLEQAQHERREMFGKDIERRAKDCFNNTGELVKPIDISRRSEEMFDEEWRNAMVAFFKKDEENGIRILSEILQNCQKICQSIAKNQLAVFSNPCSTDENLDIEKVLSSEEDLYNLRKIRRKLGLHKSIKNSVIEHVYSKCIQNEEVQKILNRTGTNRLELSISLISGSYRTAADESDGEDKQAEKYSSGLNNKHGLVDKDVDRTTQLKDELGNGDGEDQLNDTGFGDSNTQSKKETEVSKAADEDAGEEEGDVSDIQDSYETGNDSNDFTDTKHTANTSNMENCSIENSDDIDPMVAYVKNCTDMCWLAAICDPPVHLKFDVVGCHYDDIKSKFYQYCGKSSSDGTGQLKTVKYVVWPAAVQKSSSGREILIANKKGCVLLYDSSSV